MKIGDAVRIRKPGRPKIGVVTNIMEATKEIEVTFKDMSKNVFMESQLTFITKSNSAQTGRSPDQGP